MAPEIVGRSGERPNLRWSGLQYREPYLDDMVNPLMAEAGVPVGKPLYARGEALRVAYRMADVWVWHDPFSLMNTPYREMGHD